ncbi:glycosyltransferase family 9 protein [Nocardioides caldifontis]|uniref:glycosyltransferase family 9 protein n=1 Tax=Nocardioides caldifontis TaxID=2588938 RepID=UPI001EF10FA6|nr:glycosyltransferase family 9 protein [Nocardioides caldifontis]
MTRTGRRRLLVLRALGLGDLLAGVPALRALRRAHTDHELVLATPRSLEPLVRLVDAVDVVLDASGLEPLPWTGPPPALAVNLHGKGPESHRVLSSLQPGRLVAFGCPEAGHAGPRWRAEEHEVHRWCRLVEEALGVDADPSDLLLPRPPEPAVRSGVVVVHPGAAYPARRWPVDRFGEVAAWLAEQGCDVVVTGGPQERFLAEELRRRAGLPPGAVVAGETDLAELAALVAAARLVVCGDTGVAHVASAYGTPSVLLFGPTSPARWGPPGQGPHTVLWHGDGTGDPWGSEPDASLLLITVEEVVAACRPLLRNPTACGSSGRTTPASA